MIDSFKKKQLKEKYGDTQVFVVPFSATSNISDGFTREKHMNSIWSKFDHLGKYVPRYDAEGEPALQQIIPYVLVKHPKKDLYYVSKRLKGDSRLLEQISLGFGGHIEPCDGVQEVLFKGLAREIMEEIHVEPLRAAEFVGYVRGLTSTTNDHLGCVFVVESEKASIKETDSLEGEWMTVQQLEDHYYSFENWAQSIINYLVVNDKKF